MTKALHLQSEAHLGCGPLADGGRKSGTIHCHGRQRSHESTGVPRCLGAVLLRLCLKERNTLLIVADVFFFFFHIHSGVILEPLVVCWELFLKQDKICDTTCFQS